MPDELSDETLVARARSGDEAAFAALVERRTPGLRDRARRLIPALMRRKVSESDVIQAAYFAAYEKLADFENRGDGSFQAWIEKIVDFEVKSVLKRFRRAKRAVDREITNGRRPRAQDAPGHAPTPSQIAIAGELDERVQRAMEQLSPDHRLVLRLVRESGLSLTEVGKRMNRSPAAVAKLHARAVAHLTRLALGDRSDVG